MKLAGEDNTAANELDEVYPQYPPVIKALRVHKVARYVLTCSQAGLESAIYTSY